MNRLFKIYCLSHPITGIPFYVGSTASTLRLRLNGHISEHRQFPAQYWNDKMYFISNIINQGLKPKIMLLHTTTEDAVNNYELFYYLHFYKQGYLLLQKIPTIRPKLGFNKDRRKQVAKFSGKIIFKNTCIIIW